MAESSKQVRVDNWGIFFLSRLQVFFNKTDYCDLTLQFEGNVQLKVHRLVMNACTEYFQVLEQTCEVIDDVLLMPPDLQADVILPIVNFMYTGMLEFHMSVYEKLYKTAELMNIPVLLRLLDAQKHPQPSKAIVSKVNSSLGGSVTKKVPNKTNKSLPAMLPGRKLPVWKRKSIPSPAPSSLDNNFISERRSSPVDPLALDNAPKPTRFEWPDEDFKPFNLLDTSFDSISYTSKPLLTQDEELKVANSFDDSRCSSISSEENKEYLLRSDKPSKTYPKRIKMPDFCEEDVDNDLDDADYSPKGNKRKPVTIGSQNKKVRFSNVNEKENKETRINISGKGELDHSKLISEVLKKYPHLVKKNKNIRLKILAKNKDTTTETETRVDTKLQTMQKSVKKFQITAKKEKQISITSAVSESPKTSKEGPWICEKCSVPGEQVEFVLFYLYRKHMSDMHNEKIDPTLCKYCGYKGDNNKILNYHQYIKHGIMPSSDYTFPKCNKCPYIALSDSSMARHSLTHGVSDTQCHVCKVGFNNELSLKQHMQITGHSSKITNPYYDCQYCTKQFSTSSLLFSHIKSVHQEEARRDGIAGLDEETEVSEETIKDPEDENSSKVKVLSDVKLHKPDQEQIQNNMPIIPQTTQAMTNVANNIATSLGLVDIVVLDDNQQYILHANNQELQDDLNRNQEYILPELSEGHTFVQNPSINQVITSEHSVITQSMLTGPDIASTDELVMVLTDHDYNNENNEILNNDNSNIVVLYSHPVEGQENQFITSQGNLILNSETGMLELQNSNISNTETVVSQASVGESIEMIQQEINNHVNVHKNSLHLVTTTASMVSNVEEVHEEETIQEQDKSNPVNLHEPHEEIDETPDFVVENSETVVHEGGEELQTDTVDSTEPEPMEIDEVTSTQEHSSLSVEEVQSETHETVNIKPHEIYEENEEEIVHDKSENIHDEVNSFLKETSPNLTNSEAEPLNEPPPDPPETFESFEDKDESVPISIPEETTDENLKENKNDVDINQEYIPEPMEVDNSRITSIENNIEIQSQDESTDEVDNINNTKDLDEVTETEQVVVSNSLNPEDAPEEILITECASIETEDTITVPADEKVDENKCLQNTISIHDDDDDSHISVGKDSKEDTEEPSKISILADWDDTDSQQSDHANKPNNEPNSVNKLINDWDDD